MYWTLHSSGGPKLVCHDAVAIKTNIFVFGSVHSANGNLLNSPDESMDIHVIDTVKIKWFNLKLNENQDRECVPPKSYGHRVVAQNSKIYLWGGHNFDEMCNTLYCFDTITCEWTRPNVYGDTPPSIIGHGLCIIKNCIYVIGGLQQGCEYVKNVYMMDLDSMTWSIIETTGDFPETFSHSTTAIENKIYVFGGSFIQSSVPHAVKFSKFYCLDTTTRRWEYPTVGRFNPVARCFHSAFSHNGYLYIFGGIYVNMKYQFQDLHRYDPKTSSWIVIFPKGSPPCSRRGMISAVIDDRVFISGGISSSPTMYLNQPNIAYAQSKYEDDIYVLDLNPSLYNMCLVNVWNNIQESDINIKDLCIPLQLKNDLAALDSKKENTLSE